MALLAIARIQEGNNLIGIRLLDTESKQLKDVPVNSVIDVLVSRKAKIDNINVKAGKLTGSNGSIDRLPLIEDGNLGVNLP